MNILNINIFVISILSLFLWVFLVNKIYLNFYGFKVVKKRVNNRLIYNNEVEGFLIKKQVPDYIIQEVMQSEDKDKLISLYMLSKDLIDFRVFNDISFYFYRKARSVCYDRITGNNPNNFNFFVFVSRVVSIFIFFIFLGIFVNSFFVPSELGKNDFQFLYFLILILIVLMPNKIFGKSLFANKFYALLAYASSILISLTFLTYVIGNELNITHLIIQNLLAFLIILIGVYSYIGYEKFEAMVSFFELLRSNREINKNNDQDNTLK